MSESRGVSEAGQRGRGTEVEIETSLSESQPQPYEAPQEVLGFVLAGRPAVSTPAAQGGP